MIFPAIVGSMVSFTGTTVASVTTSAALSTSKINSMNRCPYRFLLSGSSSGASPASTTSPCYPADIMYYENHVLSITLLETNTPIPVLSMRTDTLGVSFLDVLEPTLLVVLNEELVIHVISISVRSVDDITIFNQIVFAFYGLDGNLLVNPIGEPWVVETTDGISTVRYRSRLIRFACNQHFTPFS